MEEQADYGGDKLKTKLCPFTNDTNGVYDCSGEDCAWWVNGECAVAVIGVDVNLTPPAVPGL